MREQTGSFVATPLRVSIITPTFNRADLLPETIDSVLGQGYPHLEYLVLDDGSTDNTHEVLARYGDRIRTEFHPNMGETRTVNKAFEMVTGDIVCVVSSDDPLLPGVVRAVVRAFEANPRAAAVYPDWATIDEHGQVIREERLNDYDLETMLLTLNWGLGPGAFFRRSFLAQVGPRDSRYTYCGDMEFWLRMAAHGPLIHLPEVLATHRVHGGSASVSERGRKMAMEWVDVFLKAMNSPALPADVRRQKQRILSDAYHIAATHYGASDPELVRKYKRRSLAHQLFYAAQNPGATLKRAARRPLAFIARRSIALSIRVLRFWLRIPARRDNTNGKTCGRFAFCTRFLPPMWSGQAVVIGRLLGGLSPDYYCLATQPVHRNRNDNDFIGTLPGKYYDLPPERRVPIGRLSSLVRYANLAWGTLQRGAAIARALREDPVDTLIGCTGDIVDPPATFLAARILHCRYFMYFFDDFTEQWWADPPIQRVVRRIERVLALRADGLISPNEYMQRELLRRYQRPSFVVRNPTPPSPGQAQAASIPSYEDEIKLVFTGAIYHLNYDVFRSIIAAIEQLGRPDVRLHLYTAQPVAELDREGLSGPYVVIHSHVPPQEVLEVQGGADILLIPFSFSPAARGIVRTSATAKLADFLMTGRPLLVICHEDSFLGWYIRKFECGVLVSSDEPGEIARAIRRILEDPELRRRLSRNAVDRAKIDFSPESAQRELLQALSFTPRVATARPPRKADAMKVVQVSGYDVLGAQVNGYLLHQFLRERGHESHMVVSHKFSDDANVFQLGGPLLNRMNRMAGLAQKAISTHCVLPVLAKGIADLPCVADADIVNLQLLHNAQYFSLLQLPGLSKKRRVVLSVHDMFLFTGHCVYSLGCERWEKGCGACPDLEIPFRILSDTTALNWKVKRRVFARSKLDLVVGSPWQAARVRRSPILSHLPLHYIPYGVDTRVYKPRDKAAIRAKLGLPQHAKVISFRSVHHGRNFKGTEYIEAALQRMEPERDTWLLTFEDKGGLDALRGKFKMLELGWIDDTRALAEALCAADVFLMPSIAEAFGLMAIESMACGTPVIVFEGTALPETINAPDCGIAVPYKDSAALSLAIDRVLRDADFRGRLRENGLRHVSAKHSFEAYAEGYLRLYERLTERTRSSRKEAGSAVHA